MDNSNLEFNALEDTFPDGYFYSDAINQACSDLKKLNKNGRTQSNFQEITSLYAERLYEILSSSIENVDGLNEEAQDNKLRTRVEALRKEMPDVRTSMLLSATNTLATLLLYPESDYSKRHMEFMSIHNMPDEISKALAENPFSPESRQELIVDAAIRFESTKNNTDNDLIEMGKIWKKLDDYNRLKSKEANLKWKPLIEEMELLIQQKKMSISSSASNIGNRHKVNPNSLRKNYYKYLDSEK